MLRSRAGYTFFQDIEVGNYFFDMYSATPMQKVKDTHYVEAGTGIEYPMEARERVIPLEVVRNKRGRPTHLKIGYHTLPLDVTS